MGTRHLIEVKHNNEIKIAQYGQWDGYPTRQGAEIARFLKNKQRIAKLKKNLKKVRFFDEQKDAAFLDGFNSRCPKRTGDPDNRTEQEKRWFEKYVSRDIGAEILQNVTDSLDEEILLRDQSDFKNDDVLCEYYYLIDLDNSLVIINRELKYSFKEFCEQGKMEEIEEFLEDDEEETESSRISIINMISHLAKTSDYF